MNIFNKEAAATPLNFKESNYVIPIIEGKEPLYSPLYNLFIYKFKVLYKYLKDTFK